MSTIILIVGGVMLLIALIVTIGYLLEKYGISDKLQEWLAKLRKQWPSYKRWFITGASALLLLIILIVVLIIIF